MKLSQRTLSILKNYSLLNNSIKVKAGNVLEITSSDEVIRSSAEVEEIFPVDFSIYKLNDFLQACSLFKEEPDLKFDTRSVSISYERNRTIDYVYCNPNLIVQKNMFDGRVLSEPVFKFNISAQQIQDLVRAASNLGLEDLIINKDNDTYDIVVTNIKTPSSNKFVLKIDDVLVEPESLPKFSIKCENIKLVPGNYAVSLILNEKKTKVVSLFKHETELFYYILTQ